MQVSSITMYHLPRVFTGSGYTVWPRQIPAHGLFNGFWRRDLLRLLEVCDTATASSCSLHAKKTDWTETAEVSFQLTGRQPNRLLAST